MKKLLNQVKGATGWLARKTGAVTRLAAGCTGDAVSMGVYVTGGAIAVTGGIVAAAGIGTFMVGQKVIEGADALASASQRMADKAIDELSKPAAVVEIVPEPPSVDQAFGFPPAVAMQG